MSDDWRGDSAHQAVARSEALSIVGAVICAALIAGLLGAALIQRPRLGNDSADYLSLAYNMAAGRGFVTDIRWHFFTAGPARHLAFGERQPAYPALLALALTMRQSDEAAYGATVVLSAVAAASVALLTGVVFGARAAWAAALMAGLGPQFAGGWAYVAPAGLYVAALVLCMAAAVAAERRWQWGIVAGLLMALAFLTRGEGLLVAAAIGLWMAMRNWRAAVVSGLCALAALAPFLLAQRLTGTPATGSVQLFHLRVMAFAEGMWYGYGKHFPSVAEFLSSHWPEVLRRLARNAAVYFAALWRLQWLGLPLLAAVWLRGFQRTSPPQGSLFVAAAAAQWAAATAVWSTTSGAPEPSHLVGPAAGSLLPLGGWAIGRMWEMRRSLAAIVLAATMATYLFADMRHVGRESSLIRDARGYRTVAMEAERYLGADDVVASCRPWSIWYLMRRPTVILPRDLEPSQRTRFLRDYDVKAIVDHQSQIPPWLDTPGVREVYRDPVHKCHVLLVTGRKRAAAEGCIMLQRASGRPPIPALSWRR